MLASDAHATRLALVDLGTSERWTYAQLDADAARIASQLDGPKSLVFLFARNTARTVIAYLAALRAGHAVALLDAETAPALRANLVAAYRPRFVIEPTGDITATTLPQADVHPDLAVLLTTSGTTGSVKFVRLSAQNVLSNADSIREYLRIGPEDRAIASLPLHYSYGLSVLNSHLRAGASVVLTPRSILEPAFWEDFAREGCTSFGGVPYSYEILARTGLEKKLPATLRVMTQAGGRLASPLALRFHAAMQAHGGKFYAMYGQTEATARIAYVPHERLPEKIGSAGVAIPRGRIEIVDGEIVYYGPNVMMGYASGAGDLAKGDELRGVLRTGDVGRLDDEGYLFITGRLKRFAKVYGLRVNLDEVESLLRGHGPLAVVSDDKKIVVYTEAHDEKSAAAMRDAMTQAYKLPAITFDVRAVDRLPLLASGKIDYANLAARLAA